jgi:hypothetical protein
MRSIGEPFVTSYEDLASSNTLDLARYFQIDKMFEYVRIRLSSAKGRNEFSHYFGLVVWKTEFAVLRKFQKFLWRKMIPSQ